ncbi:50S ribosomal protein L21, chloroplastic [Linum grandiflorum]
MIFFNLVLLVGGRQYIVIPGRLLYVQRLKGPNVNDKRTDSCSVCCLEIALNKVLLVGTKTTTYVGKPVVVTNVVVHVVVEEQPNTRIRITGITGFENYPGATLESVAASSST